MRSALSPDKWFLMGIFFLMSFSTKEAFRNNTNLSAHPFHMSVFEISHNAKNKSIEITCKLISEDLESILRTKNGIAIDLTAEADKEKNEKMINSYLQENFSLKADGTPLVLKLIGYEKEKESVYAYFEVAAIDSLKALEVRNSVFYDLSKDQAHIVHAIVGGKRQSKKLNHPETALEFQF